MNFYLIWWSCGKTLLSGLSCDCVSLAGLFALLLIAKQWFWVCVLALWDGNVATLSWILFLFLCQSTVPQPTFSMPVTVPVSNQNAAALQFTNNPGGSLVTTTSFVTSTLSDPRLLSPQQPALQRSTMSPGLPQRPASAGKGPCRTQQERFGFFVPFWSSINQ